MTDRFQNKYRIASARLQNWDYGWNASYFVTICTKNREHYFGEIENGKMVLSEIGEFAQQFWSEIPGHFKYVNLGAFVIMPNHVHGIIIINNPTEKLSKLDNTNTNTKPYHERNVNVVETPNLGVSTTNPTNPTNPANPTTGGKNAKWKPGVLGVIINQYKRICTINARKIHADFEWQSRFHDHIIRDDTSFKRIRNYIETNIRNWDDERFNGKTVDR